MGRRKGKGRKGKAAEGKAKGGEGKEGGEREGSLTLMRSWNRAADWLRPALGKDNVQLKEMIEDINSLKCRTMELSPVANN